MVTCFPALETVNLFLFRVLILFGLAFVTAMVLILRFVI